MNRTIRALLLLAALTPAGAFAAGGHGTLFHFEPDLASESSLQRGAAAYMNYCAGCHSLKYLRYERMGQDLGISEEILRKNFMFTSDKPGDTIKVAMPKESEKWFGQAPPDLSLTTRARGPDWVYSYLKAFYLDSSRSIGVNNVQLAGASMPHVLGHLQGWQTAVTKSKQKNSAGEELPCDGPEVNKACFVKFELTQPGALKPAEYDRLVADITNFLTYAGEPVKLKRYALGFWVMLFLTGFTVLAWMLYHEYWKDVH